MIPVGQAYRAAGPINLRSILSTLILGTVTASVAALAIWAWEISPVPTLIILTPILQGILIGVVLALVIGRLKLRNVWLLACMGFLCGLTSITLVHIGHHIRIVNELIASMPETIRQDARLTPEQKTLFLEEATKEPYKFADAVLEAKTGYPGLLGTMQMRAAIGVKIKSSTLQGWGMWVLWGAEALAVAGTAMYLAKNRAAQPFCEECDEWCVEENGGLPLPGTAAKPLADAVSINDVATVTELRDHPPEPAGTTYAGTKLHRCPACSQTFADVWLRTDKPKGKQTESTTKNLVTHVRISPEMLVLLGYQPAPTPEPASEGEPADPVAE